MKKLFLVALILATCHVGFCQTFTLEIEFPVGLRSGSVAWGDFNNDGMLDFIQTGNDFNANDTTVLYLNKGNSFELVDAGLPNIFEGAADWGDYDNDGDLDLLLAGYGSDGLLTRLYENQSGNLVLNESVSLHGIDRGSVGWGDYDKDGDLDILLSGQDIGSHSVTKIYNNSGGTFTEINSGITGVSFGMALWVDFDGDGDLDVMISGITGTAPSTGPKVTELYENAGNSFAPVFEGSFEGLSECGMDFGDFDNDGDLDLLIAGFTNSNTNFSAIYQNNGSTFDIVFDGSLPNVSEGRVLWGDVDNDGDLDAFISGSITGIDRMAALYANTGNGFELEFSFEGAGQNAAEFADFDSDGDLDIFISGQQGDGTIYSRIYRNDNVNESLAGNANVIPNAPSNLTAQLLDGEVLFSWDQASDNNTPQSALTYALYLRTESDTLIGANALGDGKRKLVKRGNSGNSNSFAFNRLLTPGDYFWSVQSIDNSFDGSSFANEQLLHINFPPVLVGAASTLSVPEDTPLLLKVQDLEIEDPDNEFPGDFALTVFDGDHYSVSSNEITPEENFNGTLTVQVKVNDGTDDSEIVAISVEVTPANDPPVITGSAFLHLQEATSLTIVISDLIVEDPDNDFPTDFVLTVFSGDNYTVENNEITPDIGFIGTLDVPVTVSDGIDTSDPFTLMVEVTMIVGVDDHSIGGEFSIFPNPVKDYLMVQPSGNFEPFELRIYSTNGSLLHSEYITHREGGTIDMSKFSAGAYVLRLSSGSVVRNDLILKR